jgi:hypothetical protein
MAVLGVLSLIGMVMPLRLARVANRPSLVSLAYFAALGVGFLALELVLIQRFVLFLGYPTYALSVVLAVLLASSGVGSLLSARVVDTHRGTRLASILASSLILVAAVGLGPALGRMMALPLGVRIALSTVILCPIGVVLGTAMPLGLRRFAAHYPESVAYAWGVNGVASVFTSVLGTFVALHFGFVAATAMSAAAYFAAFLLSLTSDVRSERSQTG